MRETLSQIMSGVACEGRPKRVANNTVRYQRPDGATVWRLHRTDIVTRDPDGNFTLNTGGWLTVTTKDRINKYAPCQVYSVKGVWMVNGEVPFYDGIQVTEAGTPIASGETPCKAIATATALKRRIGKFVRLVDNCETLPTPNAGDCWFCSIFKGEGDTEHLTAHMDEGYIHGALLVNAMRAAGYRDSQIGLHYQMNIRDTFKRTLRRYLGRKLGLAV